MKLKGQSNIDDKSLRIRIEQNNFSATEEVNEYLIDYIRDTLKEFCSGKNKKERSLPIRYSTIKLQSGDEVNELFIRVSGNKDKEGLLRYVAFNIVRTY